MSWRNELTVGILRAERIFYGTSNGGLGSELSTTELGWLDDLTPGTGQASKALVLDANADITSGINDFAVDADLSVGGNFSLTGALSLGTDDTARGILNLYGGLTDGGSIRVYNAADDDTTDEGYEIVALAGELKFRHLDTAEFFALNAASNNTTFSKNIYLDGVTFDNGSIVLSGGTMTGTLNLQSFLQVGVSDTTRGQIAVYGAGAGSTDGGLIYLHPAADHDGVNDYYTVGVYQDDFVIELASGVDVLSFNYGGDRIVISKNMYLDTVQLDTGAIQLDQNGITGNTDFLTGNIRVGVNDTQYGQVNVYGHTTGSLLGGTLRLHAAADYDTTNDNYMVRVNGANLEITDAAGNLFVEFSDGSSVVNFTGTKVYSDQTVELAGIVDMSGATNVADFTIGNSQSLGGQLTLAGGASGQTQGGSVYLEAADDYDTTTYGYELEAYSSNFRLYEKGAADTLLMEYETAANQFSFKHQIYMDGGDLKVDNGVNSLYLSQNRWLIGSTTVQCTATELNRLYNVVAGTGQASKAVVLGAAGAWTAPAGGGPWDFNTNSLVLNLGLGDWQINSVAVTATAAELNVLDGISATLAYTDLDTLEVATLGIPESSKVVTMSGGGLIQMQSGQEIDFASEGATCNLAGTAGLFEIDSTAVTSTAAELNILDGVTSNKDELNLVDNQVGSVAFTPAGGVGSGTIQCTFSDAAAVQMATASSFKFWFSSVATGLDFLPVTTSVVTSKGAVDKAGGVAGSDVFHGITDAAGEFDITVTAAADDYYMVVQLPSGKLQIAGVLTLT